MGCVGIIPQASGSIEQAGKVRKVGVGVAQN